MKVNITGFTNQQKTGESRKGVIGLNTLLPEILEAMKHESVRENIDSDADINIVSVLDLSSINAANAVNCLELLRKPNCIIAFDDWNIKGFYKGLDNILATKKFSKTHHSVDWEGVLSHLDVIEKLAKGEYIAIYPAYKTGDHDLLGIRGEKYCVDPSSWVDKTPTVELNRDEILAVHASLATKWRDLDKKKYSILNVRGATEDQVFDYYCRHRIVLSPPHYHDGSGWWRNRYDLANRASAVIVEDYESVFGDTYKIERKSVTAKNIDVLFQLQNEAYLKTIMTAQEAADELQNAFNKVLG